MAGTSSANPYKLSTYAGDTGELVVDLTTEASAVADALLALRRSSSPYVPALGTPDAALTDLVGDWRHLADFAGDVANAFFEAGGFGDRPMTEAQRASLVISVGDDRIRSLGHVGFADRDVAVATADRLARDVHAAMADGGITADEMRAFADRAARGQFDPAFSVTFLTGLGVDRVVGIPAMIEAAWPDGDRGRNPGWGQEMLAPFAAILTTGMDTRRATRDIDRLDPDNQNLADAGRLDEAWVDRFAGYWQPDETDVPSNLHFSLLVEHAELPTDVLVDVANRQLDWLLAHDAGVRPYRNGMPWGPTDSVPEVNILEALGANDDASAHWLGARNPGDGSLGYPGRTVNNMTLLLGYDPFTEVPALNDALARVADNGLQHWNDDLSDPLFETAVDAVAAEGEIHIPELRPVLGEGARTHIDQLAARTDEVLPGATGRADTAALRPLHNAHDFLKLIMVDDAAATSVYQGATEYIESRLAGDSGDGLGGEARSMGGLVGLVTEADENAAVAATQARVNARMELVRQMGWVKDVAGLVPVAGNLANAVSIAGRGGLSTEYRTIDWMTGATDADYADIENVRAGVRAELSAGIAAYEYGVNRTWTAGEVQAAAEQALRDRGVDPAGGDHDFFADGASGDRRAIKPYADMTGSERRAYLAWLNSDQVGDAIAVDRTVAGQRMDEVTEALEHRH